MKNDTFVASVLLTILLVACSTFAKAQDSTLAKLVATGALSFRIPAVYHDSTWDGVHPGTTHSGREIYSHDFAWPEWHYNSPANDSTVLDNYRQSGDTLFLQLHRTYFRPIYGYDSCQIRGIIDSTKRLFHSLTISIRNSISGDGGGGTENGTLALRELPYTKTNDTLSLFSLNDSLHAAITSFAFEQDSRRDGDTTIYVYGTSEWTLDTGGTGRFSLSFGSKSLLSVAPVAPLASILNVYPNPAHDRITITIPYGIAAAERAGQPIQITDLLGRTCLQCTMASSRQTIELPISSLPTGLYTVHTGNASAQFIKTP